MIQYILLKTKTKDAQALVEFSLCLPFIILVLGIMITVGQMTYTKQVLQCAAQTSGRTYIEICGEDIENVSTRETAKSMARQVAKAIITTAGYGVELPDEQEAFTVEGPMDLIYDGEHNKYKVVKVIATGKINILFPVTWQGVIVTDSDRGSYMNGSIVMLVEHNYNR